MAKGFRFTLTQKKKITPSHYHISLIPPHITFFSLANNLNMRTKWCGLEKLMFIFCPLGLYLILLKHIFHSNAHGWLLLFIIFFCYFGGGMDFIYMYSYASAKWVIGVCSRQENANEPQLWFKFSNVDGCFFLLYSFYIYLLERLILDGIYFFSDDLRMR